MPGDLLAVTTGGDAMVPSESRPGMEQNIPHLHRKVLQAKQFPAQIVFGAKVEKYLCAANLCSTGHGVYHVSGTGEKHHDP